ncbi:MAG: TetR/AcrR family transcriptional regulator C-terminal domain-containing protein [Atopobiaceae bacterium]|jgi:AcrR family transcriptional regulator
MAQAATPVKPSSFAAPSQTTDRRTTRTRRALRDALAQEIAATGDLGQVTVTAVTDRAGVTRRTFYSHFKDVPDLVNAIEANAIAQLEPLVARLAETDLDELSQALNNCEACPGAVEILSFFKERASYLPALLGDGGDPAFIEKIKRMVRSVVHDRAAEGLPLDALDAFLDYYLAFAVSAIAGVLVQWLTSGMHEDVELMSRLMTGLMFVRPGDLYGKTIDFNVPAFGLTLLEMTLTQGDNHD